MADERSKTIRGQRPDFNDDADDPTVANPEAWEDGASVESILEHVREARGAWPETVRDVAEGGMARIFCVRTAGLDRQVAMKLISPELAQHRVSVAWFIREAQVTGQLDHPNIVPVHELGVTWDGLPYFTMKLVEGDTLRDRVQDLPEGPIDREMLLDLLGVVLKVCDALAFAHSRGVVHSDIKPANVMTGEFGQVYLMDWGIASLLGRPLGGVAPAGDARVVESWVKAPLPRGAGSPGYLAPEQANGGEVDERTDVFGVGALIYYILARHPLYDGETTLEVFNRALDGDVRPLDELESGLRVPTQLRRIVERAMAPRKQDRYPSVIALQTDLQRFVRGGGDFPIVSFETGDAIVREGERADAAFVIVSGRCEVFTETDGEKQPIARLGPGDVFGETAILADSDRMATVAALESTTCVRIPIDVFRRELDDMTPWMGAITRALARRFRDQLTRSRGAAPRAAMPDPAVVFSYLAAWATPLPRARRTMAIATLVERLGGSRAVDAGALLEVLAERPGIQLDATHTQLTVTNPDALAASGR